MRYLFGLVCLLALGIMGCSNPPATGEVPECENAGDCDDGNACTEDLCVEGVCENVALCDDFNECTADSCADDGTCEFVPVEDGTECDVAFVANGVCIGGTCRPNCEDAEDCKTDFNECTADLCVEGGYCDYLPVEDETPCAGGTCQMGACALSGTVLPCTEQGIRNAIAAGEGPYTFDCDGPTTVPAEAEIVIDNDVVLDGEGNLIIDGADDPDGSPNVISVPEGVSAELRGITVTGGEGLGIACSGTLALVNGTISDNGDGGIRNEGTMTMTGVTVSDNTCPQDDCAGGIKNLGTLTMTNCTISGNQATSPGGQAGAIGNGGTITVVSSTVTGNTYAPGAEKADIFGGSAGSLTVSNSLIDADCYMEEEAVVVSSGYNIESPGDTCGLDQTGDDASVADLMLGPLQDNGGPTMTHALLPGSPALNQIPDAACEPDTDQRGEPRPETGGDACDVGAFERQPDDPEP